MCNTFLDTSRQKYGDFIIWTPEQARCSYQFFQEADNSSSYSTIQELLRTLLWIYQKVKTLSGILYNQIPNRIQKISTTFTNMGNPNFWWLSFATMSSSWTFYFEVAAVMAPTFVAKVAFLRRETNTTPQHAVETTSLMLAGNINPPLLYEKIPFLTLQLK